jgi:glycogen phosphorylase
MHYSNQQINFSSRGLSELGGTVAYFSMEIAISPDMPTYSGGLGVLAGDTMRSAADLGLGLCAVTLLHRKGYFRQHLSVDGIQSAEDQLWAIEKLLVLESALVEVTVEDRSVMVRAWRYDLEGVTGHTIPIYLLDADLPQNDPRDRELTDHLYGGDTDYRLRQEAILGIGGVRMLEALDYDITVYHMNEGHAALLTVGLMELQLGGDLKRTIEEQDRQAVRNHCVFTTHTPVPAGHDRFSMEQTHRILGSDVANLLQRMGGVHDGMLNMTYIALACSRFVNGVAMQHGKISREMFPEYSIDAITNGVHAATWTAAPLQEIFDRSIPRWRKDNFQFRYVIDVPLRDLERAHAQCKRELFETVAQRTGIALQNNVFTIGFARRVATYKRADLLLTDPERLVRCAEKFRGLQILFSGKAHPHDEPGKKLIQEIFEVAARLESDALKIVYLENYEWRLASMLTAGVDLWLNTPRRPFEASGTSGMKAALNGVPSLSVLDGWWVEGWIEGVTGWAIPDSDTQEQEVASLYDCLESTILPLYYGKPEQWRNVMRSTIALNGSFFNTHRMLQEYISNAYYPDKAASVFTAAALESALAK